MSKIRQNIEYYRTPDEIEADIGPDNVSENFANANRIKGDVTLYLAPLGQGDDTTGDGTSGNPWVTIDRAIEHLGDKIIDNTANITIQLMKGVYDFGLNEFSNIEGFRGHNVDVIGDYITYEGVTSTTTIVSVSNSVIKYGSSDADTNLRYWHNITMSNANADIEVGDYIIVHELGNIGVGHTTNIEGYLLAAPLKVVDVIGSVVTVETRWYKGIEYREQPYTIPFISGYNDHYITDFPTWRPASFGVTIAVTSDNFTVVKTILKRTGEPDGGDGLLLTNSSLRKIEGIAFIRENPTDIQNIPAWFSRGLSISNRSSVIDVNKCVVVGWTYGIITIHSSDSIIRYTTVGGCHQAIQSWASSSCSVGNCSTTGSSSGIKAQTNSSFNAGIVYSYYNVRGATASYSSDIVNSSNAQMEVVYCVIGSNVSYSAVFGNGLTDIIGSQLFDLQATGLSYQLINYTYTKTYDSSFVLRPQQDIYFNTDVSSWINTLQY